MQNTSESGELRLLWRNSFVGELCECTVCSQWLYVQLYTVHCTAAKYEYKRMQNIKGCANANAATKLLRVGSCVCYVQSVHSRPWCNPDIQLQLADSAQPLITIKRKAAKKKAFSPELNSTIWRWAWPACPSCPWRQSPQTLTFPPWSAWQTPTAALPTCSPRSSTLLDKTSPPTDPTMDTFAQRLTLTLRS